MTDLYLVVDLTDLVIILDLVVPFSMPPVVMVMEEHIIQRLIPVSSR